MKLRLTLCAIAATCVASTVAAADAPIRYRLGVSRYLGDEHWGQAREIIACADGSLLIGGQATSAHMPVTPGVVQDKYAGDDPSLGHAGIYGGDCYLFRMSGDVEKILAATYFGGSKQERNVYGMALDRQGNVVITSATRSPDAPTTEGCFQKTYGGGMADILVAKLSPDFRKLIWCTYVGGTGTDSPRGGLALDSADNVCIFGVTDSPNFPTTSGAIGRQLKGPKDSALIKLKADGSGLIFSTYLGGTGDDDTIMGGQLDSKDNIYVGGITKSTDFPVTDGAPQPKAGGEADCYMAKISADGSRLIYSTYLGGSSNEFAEHRLALTPDDCMILTGFAKSEDFPTTEGAYQRKSKGNGGNGFVTKLSADGKRWVFSTLLGGSENDNLLMPTLDKQGNIYVVGSTRSRDWPVTADALQSTFGGGGDDGVLAVLNPDASTLLYSTYLGGRGDEIVRSIEFAKDGSVYLVGSTSSDNFPVTTGGPAKAGKGSIFVVRLAPQER